jgi:adenylosuccinate synthase
MVKAYIVLGLGYGDEGKGLVTDYLCANNEYPLVIRFNGGQQAGHTVVLASGERHVFSNFGAGSLREVPTFWSAFCSFSPFHFIEEYERLNFPVKFFIDEQCPVTTHYDILFNLALEASRGNERYGSCGMGVGATMDRSKYAEITLTVNDLKSEAAVRAKLIAIRNYYHLKFERETIYDFGQYKHDEQDELFLEEVFKVLKLIEITTAEKIFSNQAWQTLIFEGAQGILLDQTFGNQPYITKSNTTSQNAIDLLSQHLEITPEIFYVTRSYATRHGAGPFSTSTETPVLINNTEETNIDNQYQGQFRIGVLDKDRLIYALNADDRFSKGFSKNLVITCLDQLSPTFNYQHLITGLGSDFKHVFGSYGPTSEDITLLLNI